MMAGLARRRKGLLRGKREKTKISRNMVSDRQIGALDVLICFEFGHGTIPLHLAFFEHISPVGNEPGEMNILLG
jgi:hypothetical protein